VGKKDVNFGHICGNCNWSQNGVYTLMCTRPVNLVTGETMPTQAHYARNKTGFCGPAGVFYEERLAPVYTVDVVADKTPRPRRVKKLEVVS
jgi:succinate dehydrogenase/fumarate reductase-like Fe-S protein